MTLPWRESYVRVIQLAPTFYENSFNLPSDATTRRNALLANGRRIPVALHLSAIQNATRRETLTIMTTSDDKFFKATILTRKDFSHDLWMIRVKVDGEFKFSPGQYATLGVDGPEKRSERPYSIVSSPLENEIEFFFELVPNGELTPKLYALKPGDDCLMRKSSKGRFTLDKTSLRTHHFLVSTVTGVAPYVSYLRTLSREGKEGTFAGEHKLYLLNGASRSWEFGYHEELKKFAEEFSWFKYVATVSRPWEDEKWTGEIGRVDELIRKYADMWGLKSADTCAYLCGHPDMIENGKGILRRVGFSRENTKEEIYWIPGKEPS